MGLAQPRRMSAGKAGKAGKGRLVSKGIDKRVSLLQSGGRDTDSERPKAPSRFAWSAHPQIRGCITEASSSLNPKRSLAEPSGRRPYNLVLASAPSASCCSHPVKHVLGGMGSYC